MAQGLNPSVQGTGSKLQGKNHLIQVYCPGDRLVLTVHVGGSCLLLLKLPYLKENYDVSGGGKRDGLTPKDEEGRSQPSAIFSGLTFCWSASWTGSVQSLMYVRASTRAATHSQGQRPTLSHSSKTLDQLKPQCITSPLCICLQSRLVTSPKKINNASFFNKWYNINTLGRKSMAEWT